MPEPETSNAPSPARAAHAHTATLKRLEKSSGSLAAQAIARMDETLPWYRAMPPENRSWIGLVAQAAVTCGLAKRALPGVKTLALKSPADLDAARDLIAEHGV
ncbi:hypothetical protein SFUMM280S_10627 [Streptomyces fumanus]